MPGSSINKLLTSGLRVAGSWVIGRRLGSGSFGDIYHGVHTDTKKDVAVKFEKAKAKHPQLIYEAKLLKRLQGADGIAHLFYYGVVGIAPSDYVAPDSASSSCSSSSASESEYYNVMVTELLGPTLEDLFNLCSRKFSMRTILFIAVQLIERIEYLHSCYFIHRDIKPENFLIGRGDKSKFIYMIDFGLSKKYFDQKTEEHIPYREDKSLTGTARYASINAHLGIEQSRRDDMEAAGYVMLYFARAGSLPWQGLKASSKQAKYRLIMEKKLSTSVESLCHKLPKEMGIYLRYCHGLRFTDSPDYGHLKSLFQNLLQKETSGLLADLDWMEILSSRSDVTKRLHKLGIPNVPLPPQFEKCIHPTTKKSVEPSSVHVPPKTAKKMPDKYPGIPFSSLLEKKPEGDSHRTESRDENEKYRRETVRLPQSPKVPRKQTSSTPGIGLTLGSKKTRQEMIEMGAGNYPRLPQSAANRHEPRVSHPQSSKFSEEDLRCPAYAGPKETTDRAASVPARQRRQPKKEVPVSKNSHAIIARCLSRRHRKTRGKKQ